uniref:Uncharacterized protein n=1 Tax=Tetraselmis sp. GSL018 TaxID=582737 RepID=A0A061RUM6_9CHLO
MCMIVLLLVKQPRLLQIPVSFNSKFWYVNFLLIGLHLFPPVRAQYRQQSYLRLPNRYRISQNRMERRNHSMNLEQRRGEARQQLTYRALQHSSPCGATPSAWRPLR